MGGRGRLHITNLLPEVEDADLKRHFVAYGDVYEAWVEREQDTHFPKGFGYVRMSNPAENARILEAAPHAIFDTTVSVARESPESATDAGEGRRESSKDEPGRFYVTHLLPEMVEDDLRQCFSQYGEVAEAHLSKDRDSGKTKGSGFVKMADPSTLEKILALDAKHEINGHEILAKTQTSAHSERHSGRQSRHEESHGRGDAESGSSAAKFYVGGLAPEHTEEQLKGYFTNFAEVSSVELVMKEGSHTEHRGYAFVKFSSPTADLEQTILEAEHEVEGQKVDVKPGKPKDRHSDKDKGGHGHGPSHHPSGGHGSYGHPPPPAYAGYPPPGGYGGYPPMGYGGYPGYPPPAGYGGEKGGYGGGAYGGDGGAEKGAYGGPERGSYGSDRGGSHGGSDRGSYGGSDRKGGDRGGYGGDRGGYGGDRGGGHSGSGGDRGGGYSGSGDKGGARGYEKRSSPYGGGSRDDRSNGDSGRGGDGGYGSRSMGYRG